MTWTARNNGLTGAALNVNYITQHPATRHLNSTSHELLLATDGGLYHSIDGGRGWAKITLPDPSNAEFADSPAATVDELHFIGSIMTRRIALLSMFWELPQRREYGYINLVTIWQRGPVEG